MLQWPVEPMRAAAVRTLADLPRIHDPRFELKWDGWRCLAWVGRTGVELQSRQGKTLTHHFPDVCRALAANVPAGVLLDGELLAWDDKRSRTSFTHLQKRITAGRRLDHEVALRPAHLVLFDVLRDSRGRSLLNEPFDARRRRLQRLLRAAPPQLVLCPQTADIDEAGSWLADTGVAGIEGLVVKPAASTYMPGKAGWIKVKARSSTELIIGGVTNRVTEPASLLLGLRDQRGTLRFLSQTHPLPVRARRDLGGHLTPMPFQGDATGHPWPVPLPAAWSLNLTDRQPLHYVQVEPRLVVEVEVDTVRDGPLGKFRHRSTMLRLRADLTTADTDILT